jgi:peptide/nickel transport system permease protein
MNPFKRYAEKLLLKSRKALFEKHFIQARQSAKMALRLDPSFEEAWLILAATLKPEDSIVYIQKVLNLNPHNEKARKAMRWVKSKLTDKPNAGIPLLPYEKELAAINNGDELNSTKRKSFTKQVLTRWQTLLSIICLLLIILIATFAPLLSPLNKIGSSQWFKVICESHFCIPAPPSHSFPLGTVDEFDVYHTLIWGMRQSLSFGLMTAAVAAIFGTFLGLISSYFGGWFDRMIMRVCDAFFAFPIIAGAALFIQTSILLMPPTNQMPSPIWNIAKNQIYTAAGGLNIIQSIIVKTDPILIALILFSWMGYTRITHSQVLAVKKEEFIIAARAGGANHYRIIFKHLLPNSITPSVVMATRDVGRMVVIQSSLTFIGIGDSSSWATILNLGKSWIIGPGGNLLTHWWVYLPITVALVFFGVTWSMLGDELNHWMNPRNL